MKINAMKISVIALAAALFVSCADNESEYNYEAGNATVHFTLGSNLLTYDTSINYSDSLLLEGDNRVYSRELAEFAFALAFDCYDSVKFSIKGGTSNPLVSYDNKTLYGSFGYSQVETVDLTAAEYLSNRQDLTSAIFANKAVQSGTETFQIFTVSVEGTNGKNQWCSNFDVGCSDAESDYRTLSATNSVAASYSEINAGNTTQEEITADAVSVLTDFASQYPDIHKGFAVAALRLDRKLEGYISANSVPGARKIILFTGHSRGAAIANILGSRYEKNDEFKSFTYCFATPLTTTAENAAESTTVFNIINTDDLVTELPLRAWGFKRFGTDKSASIADDLYAQWKQKLPFVQSYVSADGQDTSYFDHVALDRADLYKSSDASSASMNRFLLECDTEEEANAKLAILNKFGFGITGYDPYSTFEVVQDEESSKWNLKGEFRPQFILNNIVMSICLASADPDTAKVFVQTMCAGYVSPVHKNALYTMSQKLTGFAYSHSAPCYSIIIENVE